VILLSDGSANAGVDPVAAAHQAAQERIPIYTVALGTPGGQVTAGPFGTPVAVPPDPALMQRIARTSGGRSFNAQSAGELSSIYRHLGEQLGSVTRRHEITSGFAIAGLLMLVLAAGLSARFAGRFP
jgi:Ca-activated chloride channel family protein